MKGYEISITVEEFLELIPVISKELDSANKNLKEAHVIKNEIEKTRVQNLDMLYKGKNVLGGLHQLFEKYNNPEIYRLEQKAKALSSLIKKLENSLLKNFEP
jgi:hypothetical protein